MAANGWRQVPLGEVCIKIGSGSTPRGGERVYGSSGVPFIRSQNVFNDGFREEGLVFIDHAHARELDHVTVRKGDNLLDITGESVARTCLVPNAFAGARVSQHVAIIRSNLDELDPRFLHFALLSPELQNELLSLAGAGATRRALTKAMLERLPVPLPPVAKQRSIAHVLGSLDDKIELNRRMNQTLEQIAQALLSRGSSTSTPSAQRQRAAGGTARACLECPPTCGTSGRANSRARRSGRFRGDGPWKRSASRLM